MRPRRRGNPCLSNPALDLYLDSANINNVWIEANAMRNLDGSPVNLRSFMEYFLDALDTSGISVLEIAYGANLPFDFVRDYARRFVMKGLAQASPCERKTCVERIAGTSMRPADLMQSQPDRP